jgi:hypothetical protein
MKKSVSVLVWSNVKNPYGVIDSWHGTADDDFVTQIVQKFQRMYRSNSKLGSIYNIQIVER